MIDIIILVKYVSLLNQYALILQLQMCSFLNKLMIRNELRSAFIESLHTVRN